METEKRDNGVNLLQIKYIESLLVKHNLENCKSVKIVIDENKGFLLTNELIDINMYQELIGKL